MMVACCLADNRECDLAGIVREFSANVEYSDCNVDDVMGKIQ